jgi:hypothetical protein
VEEPQHAVAPPPRDDRTDDRAEKDQPECQPEDVSEHLRGATTGGSLSQGEDHDFL